MVGDSDFVRLLGIYYSYIILGIIYYLLNSCLCVYIGIVFLNIGDVL